MSDRDAILIGLPELVGKLKRPEWVYVPAGRFLDKWRQATQRRAVQNFARGPGGWVDTGETRKSITSERDRDIFPVFARVGSNLDKARWGEYGTGLLSEDPDSSRKRHWPPADALEPWAKKKKIPKYDKSGAVIGVLSGADVAAIIGIRGGLAPRQFLRDAVEETDSMIEGWLKEMATEIEKEAGRGTQ